ncbi:MAG: uroporphyrinogen decarboxylase [Fretibacterium sp.]|nr:uroporphyrinogen decarboxylase [Fretibacterium sp.]
MKMTHRQRIENALQLKETDRLPYSMWMHFPNRDRHPRRLAELTLAYQKRFDLDFMKFMPFGMYSTIDYGIDLDVFPGFVDAPVPHKPFIEKVEDWDKLRFVSGTEGEFAIVLEAQRLLFSMMNERVPFLQTVFSPMTTAAKLATPKSLAEHIKQDPYRVHRALESITQTTIQFAKATVDLGADGLFYASQFSTSDLIDLPTHDTFVRKYDMEILKAVKDSTWFNVMHLHGPNTFIRELQDYPVHAFSWHDRDDGPSMSEVRKFSSKAFLGGLSWGKNWLNKKEDEVVKEVQEVAAYNGGKGVILGPGCVINPATPETHLELVHKTVLTTAK